MARLLVSSLLAIALLAACGADEGPTNEGPGAAPDLSTPDGALRAFCAAAQARDVAKLGGLISPNAAERDLLEIRKGNCPPDALEELAELLTLEEIGEVDMEPDGMTAVVSAKLAKRDEKFTMVRVGETWLVSDF